MFISVQAAEGLVVLTQRLGSLWNLLTLSLINVNLCHLQSKCFHPPTSFQCTGFYHYIMQLSTLSPMGRPSVVRRLIDFVRVPQVQHRQEPQWLLARAKNVCDVFILLRIFWKKTDGLDFNLFPWLQHFLFQNMPLNWAKQMVDCHTIQNFALTLKSNPRVQTCSKEKFPVIWKLTTR